MGIRVNATIDALYVFAFAFSFAQSRRFFAQSDSRKVWFNLDEHHRQIHPKSSGKSLMVSAFLCECHGLLRFPDEQEIHNLDTCRDSTQTIRPGANSERYWTNSDLVKQTKIAMTIFKVLHPDSDALF